MNLVLETESSKAKLREGCVKLYDNLKRNDVVTELSERNIYHSSKAPLKELSDLLTSTMHGIQRLPSLLFYNATKSLADMNLDRYEILNNEPLHDVSNHIKNIYSELPNHLDKEKKKMLLETISLSFNKEVRNSADHRKSLLIVTNWCQQNLKNHFGYQLLNTLTEIQELLYLPDNQRSTSSILRLINTTFRHAMIIKINIRGNLHSTTSRKFFGVYYHSIVRHATDQYRLISGRTANAEKEEGMFSHLKTFTKLTSNNNPDQIITNALIRMQAKMYLEPKKKFNTESEFTSIYKPISCTFSNTVIPFTWIERYPRDYQTLLERMGDYLLDGCWWHESEEGVVFNDKQDPSADSKLVLHHFRSRTIKEETTYIKSCWEKCLTNMHQTIPAYTIFTTDGQLFLKSLKYFKDYNIQLDVPEKVDTIDKESRKDTLLANQETPKSF